MIGSEGEIRREKVFRLVRLFRIRLVGLLALEGGGGSVGSHSSCLLSSPTPIQAILIPGNERCMKLADEMRNEGNFEISNVR